eukprot:889586_1
MKQITTTVFKARTYYNRIRQLLLMYGDKTFNNILTFDIACMDTVMNNRFELKFLEINFWCGFYCSRGKEMHNRRVDSVGDDSDFCDAFANETSDILIEIYEK